MKINFEEARKKILELLRFNDMPAAAGDMAPVDALKDYTTDAGVVVKIDKLEAGGKVYQEDGTTPVAGDITLQDGTIVSCDQNGMITAVTAPVPMAQEPEMPQVTPPAPPAPVAQFEAMDQKFLAQEASFKQQIEALKTEREKDRQNFTEAMKQVLDLVQKFADEPSGDPIQQPADKTPEPSKKERAQNLLKQARQKAAAI